MKSTCGATRLQFKIEKVLFQNLKRYIFFKSKSDALFFFKSKSDT